MNKIEKAAQELLSRRMHRQDGARLAEEIRPTNLNEAFKTQQYMAALWRQQSGESIRGWKCLLPPQDKIIVGPIYSRSIYSAGACELMALNGQAAIEPEFAFVFGRDFAPQNAPYTEAKVLAAVASVTMALELIKSRFTTPADCSFPELLADGLFNQGLVLGPKILRKAPADMKISLEYAGDTLCCEGKHPNANPYAPLTWLVNYLCEHGITLKAGQVVITGSYAGVFHVPFNEEIKVTYENIGEMIVKFSETVPYPEVI